MKSTQQITKAMKMVAASKLRRAQERTQQARPFATQMLRVLNSLASRVDPASHPLLDERTTPKAGGRVLLIVVTADRGLARASRDAGAKSLTPADFWNSFGKISKPHAGPSKPEAKVNVDEWIEYFSNPDNRKS